MNPVARDQIRFFTSNALQESPCLITVIALAITNKNPHLIVLIAGLHNARNPATDIKAQGLQLADLPRVVCLEVHSSGGGVRQRLQRQVG